VIRVTVLGVDTAVVVGAVVALSAVVGFLIALAPWSAVRDEGPLPPDIEARLLLGEDPDTVAADADAVDDARAPASDHDPRSGQG
jgi:hypothetical protein